jgi:hypothetical protein
VNARDGKVRIPQCVEFSFGLPGLALTGKRWGGARARR